MESTQKGLPVVKLLPLALAGFIAIMTETMPAGLLPQISTDLHIKASYAGQLITFYALGSFLAAIPVITATLHWNRKHLLLSAIIGFLLFNGITALSADYFITLAARFLAGIGAGITWSLLVGYTTQIVPPDSGGRALALVSLGQPVALAMGVPAATWLGQTLGLAGAFGLMSLVSLVLIVWAMVSLPGIPGNKRKRHPGLLSVLKIDGIKHILFVTGIWIIAHNIFYTYIAPFLAAFGMGRKVDLLLFVFGLASCAGIFIIGFLIDKRMDKLIRISLLVFAAGAGLLALGVYSQNLISAGIFLWGLSLGGIATLLQKKLADYAGENADVAQSMLVTVFNLAVAAGGVAGGILLDQLGPGSFPWAVLILTAIILYSLVKRQQTIKQH